MKKGIYKLLSMFLCVAVLLSEYGTLIVDAAGSAGGTALPAVVVDETVQTTDGGDGQDTGEGTTELLTEEWKGILYQKSGTVELTEYLGEDKDIVIPPTIQDHTVVALGDGLFADKDITSVKLADTVTSIGKRTFSNCTQLSSVDLANTEVIGNYSFEKNTALTEVTLPETLTSLGSEVFSQCTGIQKVIVKAHKLEKAGGAFSGCVNLRDAVFDEKCTVIPTEMFQNSGIQSFVLPEQIKTIGDSAFKNCTLLEEVELGNVETIGKYCFEGDAQLKRIHLPETVLSIGTDAFYQCSSMEFIEYDCADASIQSNYGTLFQSLPALREVHFGESVKRIPRSLLAKSQVETVMVEGDHVFFSGHAMEECDALREVYFKGRHYTFEDDTVFFATPNVTVCTGEYSDALCYALEQNLKYTLCQDRIDDIFLDRSRSGIAIKSYSKTSRCMELQICYALQDIQAEMGETKVTLYLGNAVTLLSTDEAVKINGQKVSNYTLQNGRLTIPVHDAVGELSLLLNTAGLAGKQGIYARVESDAYDDAEVIGTLIIGEDIIAVSADARTSGTLVPVKGYVPGQQSVRLLLDETEVLRVESNKLGFYEGTVDLGEPISKKSYVITAEITYEGEVYRADTRVQYDPAAAKVTQFDFYYYTIHNGTRKLDLLECADNSIVYYAPTYGNRFCVDFDNRDEVDKVYAVSNKDGEVKTIELEWNETLDCYYSDDYFDAEDHSYVPGDLTVFYTKQSESVKKDISTQAAKDAVAKEQEELLDDLEMPDPFKNINIDVIANTAETFQAVYTNAAGSRMDVRVNKIASTNANYRTVYDKVYTSGENIGSGQYALCSIEDDTIEFTILDIVKGDINELILDNASDFIGWDEFGDCTKNLYDLVHNGDSSGLLKDSVLKYLNVNSDCFDATYESLGVCFEDLAEYKYIYYSDMSEEEKASRLADLNKKTERKLCYVMFKTVGGALRGAGIKMALGGNLWGLAIYAAAVILEDYLNWYANKYDGDGLGLGQYLEYTLKKLKFIIDPSGTVYEAVTTNYLEDVRATIYYRNGEEEVQWDADEYMQKNPVVTEIDGAYAWDVPEGQWRVKFEKEGYETAYTDWMDVPPEQTDVNIGMISTEAPVLVRTKILSNGVGLTFSQYMDPASMTDIKVLDSTGAEVAYELVYPSEEHDATGRVLAREYSLCFTEKKVKTNAVYSVVLENTLTNYCGKHFAAQVVETTAVQKPSIRVTDNVRVAVGSTVEIPIQIDFYTGEETILCSGYNSYTIRAVLSGPDQSGSAVLNVTGLIRGSSKLHLELAGCDENAELVIEVGEVSDTELQLPDRKDPEWDPEEDPGEEEPERTGIWFEEIPDMMYTGKAIKPEVGVYDGQKLLVSGRDYTVSYKNNVHAGEAEAIIKGKGDYSGTERIKFNILPVTLDKLLIPDTIYAAYTGKIIKPAVTIYDEEGRLLKEGKNFSLEIKPGDTLRQTGLYSLTIRGKDDYAFEKEISLCITESNLTEALKVSRIKKQIYQDGEEIKPAITVTMGKNVLAEGTDYSLTYRNNRNPGTAFVIITGLTEKCVGTRVIPFRIDGISIAKAKLDGVIDYVYSGQNIEQTLTSEPEESGCTVTLNGRRLKEGEDFGVSYKNNRNAGTATMVITGIGGYAGTVKKSFKILPYEVDVSKAGKSGEQICDRKGLLTIYLEDAAYAKGGAKPKVQIGFEDSLGEQLLQTGTDYMVSYKNNKKIADKTDVKAPAVTIKFKGNFKGSVEMRYSISTQNLNRLTMEAQDKTIGNGRNAWKQPNVKIRDLDGKVLKAGIDYERGLVYTLENGEELTDTSTVVPGTEIFVTAKGIGNYADSELTGSYRVVKSMISRAQMTVEAQEYTGKPVCPKVTDAVFGKDKSPLVEDVDYVIVGYANNEKRGTATMTIKGIGDYGGTKVLRFKIGTRKLVWYTKS